MPDLKTAQATDTSAQQNADQTARSAQQQQMQQQFQKAFQLPTVAGAANDQKSAPEKEQTQEPQAQAPQNVLQKIATDIVKFFSKKDDGIPFDKSQENRGPNPSSKNNANQSFSPKSLSQGAQQELQNLTSSLKQFGISGGDHVSSGSNVSPQVGGVGGPAPQMQVG